jgi:hypothetical protein
MAAANALVVANLNYVSLRWIMCKAMGIKKEDD